MAGHRRRGGCPGLGVPLYLLVQYASPSCFPRVPDRTSGCRCDDAGGGRVRGCLALSRTACLRGCSTCGHARRAITAVSGLGFQPPASTSSSMYGELLVGERSWADTFFFFFKQKTAYEM